MQGKSEIQTGVRLEGRKRHLREVRQTEGERKNNCLLLDMRGESGGKATPEKGISCLVDSGSCATLFPTSY
jgi:hypothetical protein